MNKIDQMSFFGFEPEAGGKPAKPAKATPAVSPTAASVPAAKSTAMSTGELATDAQSKDAEAMAQALAQHPDFRVLRRLVPQTDYGNVQGQAVNGYNQETGVNPNSSTETFVALRTEIANWRWAGVPFYIRTGKRLASREGYIEINFRPTPHAIFQAPGGGVNKLVIHLQPKDGLELHLFAEGQHKRIKTGNQASTNLSSVHLDLDFDKRFGSERVGAYERLLLDVLDGRLNLFVRSDEQEEAWRWVEPILQHWATDTQGPRHYAAGTWGPSASSAMIARDGFCWSEEN